MIEQFKKKLRQNSTNLEQQLWYQLRGRRFSGFKFRRQHQILHYIVDFICLEQKLVIELNGSQHAWNKEYEYKRNKAISEQGFKILSFWNNQLVEDFAAVLDVIYDELHYPSPA